MGYDHKKNYDICSGICDRCSCPHDPAETMPLSIKLAIAIGLSLVIALLYSFR